VTLRLRSDADLPSGPIISRPVQPLGSSCHLDLATFPIIGGWIGIAEYLFRFPTRAEAVIEAALYDVSHLSDDLQFVVAAMCSFGSAKVANIRIDEITLGTGLCSEKVSQGSMVQPNWLFNIPRHVDD
jgi:hypothetical protein